MMAADVFQVETGAQFFPTGGRRTRRHKKRINKHRGKSNKKRMSRRR
jgi:hypothetical protein